MVPSLKDLMSKNVVSVMPDTPLVRAVDILLKNDYSGLPVVDKNNILVGIITDYDLILKGSSIHLPTFLQLLQQFEIYKKDVGPSKRISKKSCKRELGI